MKRMVIGTLACVLALGASAPLARATPKKGNAKPEAQHQDTPSSSEISKAMGELKWGMPRDGVMEKFMTGVKEKYKPLIAKSTGAIEEDKLRAKMRDELGRIRSSLVEFDGNKTGWDVSFLKGEFTHHNHESMFVVNDDTSQNYYFFINGKLWKWYKAFNASVFKGRGFDVFAEAVQGRYGKAQLREGELLQGSGKQRWLEWQDAQSRLRAIDNNQFYGFYCLVFEHKDTVRRLPELRTAKPTEKRSIHAMVESVTTAGDEPASDDSNKDIVDRLTGRIRNRQDAAEDKTKPKKGNAAATPAPTESGSSDDDPLRGL